MRLSTASQGCAHMWGCTSTDSRVREVTAPSAQHLRPHVNTLTGLGLHCSAVQVLGNLELQVYPALSEETGGTGGERTR